jgi:hypothetical protein
MGGVRHARKNRAPQTWVRQGQLEAEYPMFAFENCKLSDAEILSVESQGTKLLVRYKDWKEIRRTIIFEDAVGYQCFCPEGQALSHGTVEQEDPFLDLAARVTEEDVSPLRVFSFVSAWSDAKILRVVATGALQE